MPTRRCRRTSRTSWKSTSLQEAARQRRSCMRRQPSWAVRRRRLKEAQQQRQSHRTAWLAHLTESMKLWEGQLEEFKKRQMALREAEQKAAQDISSARSTIQQLNQNSSGTSAERNGGSFPRRTSGNYSGQRRSEPQSQASADPCTMRISGWGHFDSCRNPFGWRRGEKSEKGPIRGRSRCHYAKSIVTLGCFFTCPLVKGGSTQPWPYP